MHKIRNVLINKNTKNEVIDDRIQEILKKKKDITKRDYDMLFPFSVEEFTQRLKTLKQYQAQLELLKKKPVLQQRTEEWYRARTEMLTASDTFDAVRKVKSLVRKKALKTEEKISSYALYWGTTFEPVALDIYSKLKHDTKINEFGLLPHDTMGKYGASPDGITDLGIMVEIKCPLSRMIIENEIPPKYMAQMQGQMAVCNLKECDYCELKFVPIDANEYLASEGKENLYGMITEKDDGTFMYSDLEANPSDEYLRQTQLSFKNRIFWKLDQIQIIRVDFNVIEWNNYYVPKINDFWNEVDGFDEQTYQNNKRPYNKKTAEVKFVEESDDEK